MKSEIRQSIRYMAFATMMRVAIAAFALSGLSGCATPGKQIMTMETSQVNLRSMQSRTFDTTDEKKALRTVISTLQDFDFLIDEANRVLGVVSATRRTEWLQITVTVRTNTEKQLLVRANMEFNRKGVEDPSAYLKFFSHLEKSMFLTAHELD